MSGLLWNSHERIRAGTLHPVIVPSRTLPLRRTSMARRVALRVIGALLGLSLAGTLLPLAFGLGSERTTSSRPTEQVSITAELLTSPEPLPSEYVPLDRYSEDPLPGTAATVELSSGELRVVYGLPASTNPGPVKLYRLAEGEGLDPEDFASFPVGVSGEGEDALSVRLFPSQELPGERDPWRWTLAAWLGALGLWGLCFTFSCVVSAFSLRTGAADGVELAFARRDGLALEPDIGLLQWDRLQELGFIWRYLPRAWAFLAALAISLSALSLFLSAISEGSFFQAAVVFFSASLVGLFGALLPTWLGARLALRLKSRHILPRDPSALPAWILLVPSGDRHLRRLRRTVGPAGVETALTFAAEQAVTLADLESVTVALEGTPSR